MDHLHVGNPVASASLHAAEHETLAPATAPHPEEEEYYYDSDNSVIDLDMEYPDISEHVVGISWRPQCCGCCIGILCRISFFPSIIVVCVLVFHI